MDPGRKYDEESLQHIYALLQRHDKDDILRMVLDVAKSRPTSILTSASRFSHISSESRYSGFSTDYATSVPSSASSRSRPRHEPLLYRSGLTATKPASSCLSSPTSDAFSSGDTLSLPSPPTTDFDSKSVASSTAKRGATTSNGGPWFCTFCTDYTTFAAKADWKKHETNHHETGEDWPCPIRNCFEVLDRKLDFKAHFKRHHPDVPCPIDVHIRLLPKSVYACGFDGCKDTFPDWTKRCDHVALHMKPKGTEKRKTHAGWSYSKMIHNLLRQDATQTAWKSLFANLENPKEARNKITWVPENTRVLKQKLECGDMRPEVDVILHTALELRADRPFNDVVDLDPEFKTPSQDSVPHFDTLSEEQLALILRGRCAAPNLSASTSYTMISTPNFVEPHPGDLVAFDIPSPTISGRRVSYMDVDTDDFPPSGDGPDPQIPPGLELDPSQMQSAGSPKPFQIYYAHLPAMEDLPQTRRSSRGHIFSRHFKGRKG
ncbi:hypothetical protein BU23DRAFT_559646 [Bimuria novae-zelandiae CBS 107.79]|uniref:C2H2-type domain-containing protein n=1 Tax=Bimuria novae-zelandiae CBS 107.79 TaxID=1447943 RepID=A0A6A5V1B0_9PLEO|nr:hypothetical protein BU23DRAFT_559646 [Bimuria novae-zelandiae CBS 107.79]